MSYELTHAVDLISSSNLGQNAEVQDYATILNHLDFPATSVDYYLQVGEVKPVRGWLLHVSVVRSQIPMVLCKVLPILRNTPFKVVKSKDIARSLLDGDQGPALVGKIIKIFPNSESDAVELAKKLIQATLEFDGPVVLTDIHLGGLVYTSYGGFAPVFLSDNIGKEKEYIFDKNGALVENIVSIPFMLPEGVEWPFSSIVPPVVAQAKKIIKGKYLTVKLLKSDCKGNVTKSLYVNSRLGIHWCVVKQGKRNMWADESGRDMRDRLAWQQELYHRLGGIINMPKIIELFEENGDAYLVQDYIPSKSLMDKIYSLNRFCRRWWAWTPADKRLVMDYLLQVLDAVANIHWKNIVHRDLTPVNFLVCKDGKLVLIDSELAYDRDALPTYRPYIAGTRGFMSPEQIAAETPTIKEDIYAIGALMIAVLTGLAPLTLGTLHLPLLGKNLYYFLGNEGLAQLIVSCLNPDPIERPDLEAIQTAVKKYMGKIDSNENRLGNIADSPTFDKFQLRNIIDAGIKGLLEEPTLTLDGLWLSRNSVRCNMPGRPNNNFGKSAGLHEGISGVLYFLARAKDAGFDISVCLASYEKAWAYIQETYLDCMPSVPAGLYGGSAGIALAMAMGIKSGLLENTDELKICITQCFSLPNSTPDVAAGVAGMGIAVLQCREFLEGRVYQNLLEVYVRHLMINQFQNKYWIFRKGRLGRTANVIGFSNGNTGIIWFLLAYNSEAHNPDVNRVVLRSLRLLKTEAKKVIQWADRHGVRGLVNGNVKILDGLQGLVLVFIKAYEVLKEPVYKGLAERLLEIFPMGMVHDNIFQDTGLSGIGELHLEAYRVFQTPLLRKKADCLVEHFLHMYQKGANDTCHWVGNNADFPTADLMVGNTGILHFLLRCFQDNSIGYRLLG